MTAGPDRSILVRNVAIGVAVLAIVVVLFVFWRQGRLGPRPTTQEDVSEVDTGTAESALRPSLEPVADPAATDAPTRAWTRLLGAPPVWPADLSAVESCEEINQDISRVCAALDVRAPALRGSGGACSLLEQLAGELVANPPDLSSELRSYDTMLGNVFHLFRVAGRERIELLQRLLLEEEIAEPAALALYRWAMHHGRCGRSTRKIDAAVRYAYAGFLFNTMGGQAYLRRRSPRVEALVCFYALQAIDGAIRDGYNPQGLDPRSEISRCRDLVVSQPLVFSEKYAESLDEMASRWRR
jgi:hypothetical protein